MEPHVVAVLALPPVVAFDMTIPDLIFSVAFLDGRPLYKLRPCALKPGQMPTTTGGMTLLIEHGLDELERAQTVIVPGTHTRENVDPAVIEGLRRAHDRGARIAAICTGAFVLAAAGLLDDRPATTHWQHAEQFSASFPKVRLDPRVLYVDDGQVMTSAGLAAGIDLCLHLVRRDFGTAVANDVARYAVVSLLRQGDQAQVLTASPRHETELARLMEWAIQNLEGTLSLEEMSQYASMSVRTLTRRFTAETGVSPQRWLLLQRISQAQELLETTSLSVAEIARRSGLGSADSLRAHLVRKIGLTPTAYRSSFTRR